MNDVIQLVYIAPIGIAFACRLVWWIWFSAESDSFFPDTTKDSVDINLLALAVWPLTLFCVVACLLIIAIFGPFWAIVRALRAARLRPRQGTFQQHATRHTTGNS